MGVERFYNDDSDDQEYDNFEDGFDEEEGESVYVDQDGLLEVMQMDLAQTELNQRLLEKAVSIAEKGFFWRFRSTKSKMKEIADIYKELLAMTDQNDEKEGQ